jgi:lipid-A-disaccharide synthase
MMVAGEASADLHGSRVIEALRRLDPEIQVYGMGSEHMRRAGAELIIDSSQLAVLGITEVFGRIGGLFRAYRKIKNFIKKNKLNLLILIDFPDFNLSLARVAKLAGVPVLYYISPQVWAWRYGRVRKIAGRTDKMAVIFPFEVPIYQGAGLDVEFVGHPLLDVLALNRQEYAPGNHSQLSGGPLIALLPGSRETEIQSLLPEMLRAADILAKQKPEAKFILPAAPGIDVQELEKFLGPHSISIAVVEGQTYAAIKAADMVIVASGTATLETAILGKPMVIVYKVSPLSYWVGKTMVKLDWIGLVNIVAGKKVVPELLQKEARGERIAEEALRILNDEAYRRDMVGGLEQVREKLGVPGAAERVARMALEMIEEKEAISNQLSATNKDG